MGVLAIMSRCRIACLIICVSLLMLCTSSCSIEKGNSTANKIYEYSYNTSKDKITCFNKKGNIEYISLGEPAKTNKSINSFSYVSEYNNQIILLKICVCFKAKV